MASGGVARPGVQAKRYDPEGAKATDATRVCGAEKREGLQGGGREQSSLVHPGLAEHLAHDRDTRCLTWASTTYYALQHVTATSIERS